MHGIKNYKKIVNNGQSHVVFSWLIKVEWVN